MASKHKRYILLMSLLLSHKMILCLVCNYKHVGRETKICLVYGTMGTCKCFLILMLYLGGLVFHEVDFVRCFWSDY